METNYIKLFLVMCMYLDYVNDHMVLLRKYIWIMKVTLKN
jgi:hypothetical protein